MNDHDRASAWTYRAFDPWEEIALEKITVAHKIVRTGFDLEIRAATEVGHLYIDLQSRFRGSFTENLKRNRGPIHCRNAPSMLSQVQRVPARPARQVQHSPCG